MFETAHYTFGSLTSTCCSVRIGLHWAVLGLVLGRTPLVRGHSLLKIIMEDLQCGIQVVCVLGNVCFDCGVVESHGTKARTAHERDSLGTRTSASCCPGQP